MPDWLEQIVDGLGNAVALLIYITVYTALFYGFLYMIVQLFS